nr:putative erythronate-4-phosphate dehydrogenase family protein [Tanacetum cinerariifolium]
MDHHHQNHTPFNYTSSTSGWLEIRLFYVRITPCSINTVPQNLTLRNLRREIGVSLEINAVRVPSSNTALVNLRRDRLDTHSSEVTYVSTDNIRLTGPIEFEVINNNNGSVSNCNGDCNGDDKYMILCGSLERIESGWSMEFYAGNLGGFGSSSPSIEVYIAGCCASVPVILTKTISVSPRRRGGVRKGGLDAIPEDEEVDKGVVREIGIGNGSVRLRKLPHTGEEPDEYAPELKVGPSYYSDEMYYDEDGQLTWFNAGVRVGVGIGLGMCLGIGIGVGLLMRSYQATTRNFRRRFF